MERQRDEDEKESTICHSTRSFPPAQDRQPGPGGCSATRCYTAGFWLCLCHPLTLANTWSWSYLQGSESTGLHVTLRAAFLTAHHWPQPHPPGKPARASGWQVQGVSVLLGGQGDCTQPQPPLLSAPEPPARSQLISSTTQSHSMLYWDTAWSCILSGTWHSSTLVQGGQRGGITLV